MPHSKRSDGGEVVIVGGGVIGLAVAWRVAQRGARVTVLDARREGAAWPVSAGMLAPVAEAVFGEDDLLALGLESARRWPGFADELAAASGADPGYRRCGTLVVARDRDEAEALDREAAYRRDRDLPVERLLPSEALRRESGLAPALRLALDVPDDHAVDPRALRAALGEAVRREGGDVRDGVDVTDLADLEADHVVVANGVWAAALADVPIRPVKGQILRLRDPAGPGLADRVIRMAESYVVPRGDGRYVLGATVEERGHDTALTAGGLFELLRDASEVLPGLLELEIEETAAGLRPATPDNGPLLGAATPGGPLLAAGHFRNGILLAPVTADAIAALVAGEDPPPETLPFAADRFGDRVTAEVTL